MGQSEIQAICKQNTIVDENGKEYCDFDRCPFAKRSLDINFYPTDMYRCTANYPYLTSTEIGEKKNEQSRQV